MIKTSASVAAVAVRDWRQAADAAMPQVSDIIMVARSAMLVATNSLKVTPPNMTGRASMGISASKA